MEQDMKEDIVMINPQVMVKTLIRIGTYYYHNGSKYIGNYANGNITGRGTCFFDNGDKYEGQWKDGLKCGKGNREYDI